MGRGSQTKGGVEPPAPGQRPGGLGNPSPRRDRGPRPGLSLPQIVAASAMAIASSDDLAAVSMSRVAAELGVATMSLYRYVAAKDELLTLMMDAAFYRAFPEAADAWRALAAAAGAVPALRRNLAALRQHPWVVRIPVWRTPDHAQPGGVVRARPRVSSAARRLSGPQTSCRHCLLVSGLRAPRSAAGRGPR